MIYLDTNNEVTNSALETWKIETQMDILQEECGEVITAISRWERKRVDKNVVAEEVADVLVSMMSVIPGLGIEEQVKKFMKAKLIRLSNRILEYERDADDNK